MEFKGEIAKKIKNNELNLNSWGEYTDFINDQSIDCIKNCIFRGQSNSEWKLTPSLFREQENDKKKREDLCKTQIEHFKKFSRSRHAIHYDDYIRSDFLFQLGQHYGLKTPLLDWSYSPYIAAFFAYINNMNPVQKIAIFCLWRDSEKGKNDNQNALTIYSPMTHANARLIVQSGVFTYDEGCKYANVEKYVYTEENKNEDKDLLLKIILSAKRKKVLERLNQMNINECTLFPDLDGAARYCNYLLE